MKLREAGPAIAAVVVLLAVLIAASATPRPTAPSAAAGWQRERSSAPPAPPSTVPPAAASPTPRPQPVGRLDPSMVWDPVHQVVLLYGGRTSAGDQSDTWTWDGASWSLKEAHSAPGELARLAFDSARGQALAFGPKGTYTWDGAEWTQQHPQHTPPGAGNMAYNPSLGVVLMLPSRSGGTWAWNGSDWSRLADGERPAGTALVYDARSARMLAVDSATWAFAGLRWTRLGGLPDSMPALGGAAAYAGSVNQPLLFGGDPQFGSTDRTWAWDGSQWKERTADSRPPGRMFPGIAFDAKHGQLVMFGGAGTGGSGLLGDTWTWQPDRGWSQVGQT